ncbi:MAG: hypothetical protein ACLUNZ_08920 [Evtepia sp.]
MTRKKRSAPMAWTSSSGREAWYRSTEVHEERAYSIETLTEALRQAGFLDIHTYGDRRLDAPQAGEARVFFTARKPEEAIEHMR